MRMMEDAQGEDGIAAAIWAKLDEHKRTHNAELKEFNKLHPKRRLWLKLPVADIKAIDPDPYTAVFLYLRLLRMMRQKETEERGFSYVECEKLFGVNHQAAYRALQQLETKGLISIDWRNGAKPRVAITSK